MSYCVNCGVELEPGSKRCPLCAVPVINPYDNQSQSRAYPEKVVLPPKVRRRYSAILISLIMLIPNIICSIVNYFFTFDSLGAWSLYVNIPSVLVWVFFCFAVFVETFRSFYHHTYRYNCILCLSICHIVAYNFKRLVFKGCVAVCVIVCC